MAASSAESGIAPFAPCGTDPYLAGVGTGSLALVGPTLGAALLTVMMPPYALGFDAYPRLASPGHAQPTPVRMAASARTPNATEYEVAVAMAPTTNAPSPVPASKLRFHAMLTESLRFPRGRERLSQRQVLQAAIGDSHQEQAGDDQDVARAVVSAVRSEPDRGQP